MMRELAWLGLAFLPWQSMSAEPVPADAARLYQEYCSVCHGERGDGRSRAQAGLVPPPRDFTTPGLAERLTRAAMVEIILNGKPGTAMAAWRTRLSAEQAEAIADYVRREFMQAGEPAQASRGAQLYTSHCAVCHGDEGAGSVWASSTLRPPPRNFSAGSLTREQMLAAVAHGRPGTAMPAFSAQLGAEEIALVVDYVRSTFMPAAAAQVAAEPDAAGSERPMPGGLEGDVGAGEAFYRLNCATCHGIEGNGEGPRAYFIFPRPRDFLSPATREALDRPRLFQAIKDGVVGREMPAWGKVLSDQQIADVAEYVYRAFLRPAGSAAQASP